MPWDDSTAWQVDPCLLGDSEHYSNAYGASHLTCDGSAYGKEGVPLNPFYLQSRWNEDRTSDPAVPLPTVKDDILCMTTFVDNLTAQTFSATLDTTLRNGVHSTGLVHEWWRVETIDDQLAIASAWPSRLNTVYGLSDADQDLTSTCAFPDLRTCMSKEDCG